MIEPQSEQDGESALTLKATFVPAPRSNGFTATGSEWPFE